jgi:hypothetical protein
MNKRLLSSMVNRAVLFALPLAFLTPAFAHADPKTDFHYYNNKVNVVVRGTVKDLDGNPLGGATIREKGTNNTVVSAENGTFSITVKDGATLVFSYVGYEEQELSASPEMNVTLLLLNSTTTEVVVTALGIRKEKAKISYATQEVKGSALDKVPESNIANNLIGKVAGLNILSKSNLFENPEIYLRGKQTLVVIDGVPTDKDNFDFWNLNPNDI